MQNTLRTRIVELFSCELGSNIYSIQLAYYSFKMLWHHPRKMPRFVWGASHWLLLSRQVWSSDTRAISKHRRMLIETDSPIEKSEFCVCWTVAFCWSGDMLQDFFSSEFCGRCSCCNILPVPFWDLRLVTSLERINATSFISLPNIWNMTPTNAMTSGKRWS